MNYLVLSVTQTDKRLKSLRGLTIKEPEDSTLCLGVKCYQNARRAVSKILNYAFHSGGHPGHTCTY